MAMKMGKPVVATFATIFKAAWKRLVHHKSSIRITPMNVRRAA
jgi:hypothetical protein